MSSDPPAAAEMPPQTTAHKELLAKVRLIVPPLLEKFHKGTYIHIPILILLSIYLSLKLEKPELKFWFCVSEYRSIGSSGGYWGQ